MGALAASSDGSTGRCLREFPGGQNGGRTIGDARATRERTRHSNRAWGVLVAVELTVAVPTVVSVRAVCCDDPAPHIVHIPFRCALAEPASSTHVRHPSLLFLTDRGRKSPRLASKANNLNFPDFRTAAEYGGDQWMAVRDAARIPRTERRALC